MTESINMEKISVIVPAYNVEKYLERCLQSILKQTYKNIEIIIINDGSTDNTEQICNSFSEKNDNIRYYQLDKNMGISYVRNFGLEKVSGDLIGFVDSDDWIDEKMYETLYRMLVEYKSSIAVCNYTRIYNNGEYSKVKFSISCDCYYDNIIDALRFNINHNDVTLWNKLYRKNLFDNLRFPIGQDYEDTAVMHLLIERAGELAVSYESLYHYNMFFRNNSITSEKATNRSFECINAYIARHEFIMAKYQSLEKDSRKYIFRALIWLADRVVRYDVDITIVDRFISVRDITFEKYGIDDCGLEEIELNLLMLLKSSIRSYKIARQMKEWAPI